MPYKKGDRVQYRQKTGVEHGTVVKGGTKRVVVACDDGENEVVGPATAFQPSKKAPPKDDPSPLDRWGIKGYKTAGGDETVRFTATITLDGKPVLVASNGGRGANNHYAPYDERTSNSFRENLTQLEQDVKAAIEQFGGGLKWEVVDFWVLWKGEYPFQTFASHLAGYRKYNGVETPVNV